MPEESQQILSNSFQNCRACGTAISAVATFCSHCGARTENAGSPSAAPLAAASGLALFGKVLLAVVFTAILLVVGVVLFYVVVLGVALASCLLNPGASQTSAATPTWMWAVMASVIGGIACLWLIVMLRIFK